MDNLYLSSPRVKVLLVAFAAHLPEQRCIRGCDAFIPLLQIDASGPDEQARHSRNDQSVAGVPRVPGTSP